MFSYVWYFDLKKNIIGDETMSSKAYRLRANDNIKWPEKLINLLFFFQKDHCYNAFLSERNGRHLPPEARK